MDPESGKGNGLWAVGAVLASAALFYFSTGLHPIGTLAWFAPLPVLLLAFRSGWKTAAIGALGAFALGQLNLVAYLLRLVPPALAAAAIVAPAAAFALAVTFARLLLRRAGPWPALFAFPAAWTAYEFLLSRTSPHGTFGSLAYSQMEFLPVIQVASVAGIWGVTFLLALAPAGAAAAWQVRRRPAAAAALLAAGLVPLLLALGFGWFRLAQPAGGPAIRVGLAVTDRTVDRFRTEERSEAIPVAEAYARRAATLTTRGARVVVLPEKFVGVTPAYAADVYKIFSSTAQAGDSSVIAGLNWVGINPQRNLAVVFSPDGRYLEYDKAFLVPGWEEGYHGGNRPLVLPLAGVPAGVAVCKDMDFPAWTRRYALEGARVMCVPAWDFGEDAWLHSRMAVLRGVEGGFAVVRTAQEGRLTVSDACGRTVAEKRSDEADEVYLECTVPAGPGGTLYGRWGDWFGWLSVAALAAGLLLLSRPRPAGYKSDKA